MSYEHFEEDLRKGIKAEEGMKEMLKKEKPTLKKYEGYNPDYDLYDDFGYTAEVKLDIASGRSDNIAIEYLCEGKISGISRTKAEDWIHIYKFENEWVYTRCKVEDLKKFIKGSKEKLKRVAGGDDKNSMLLLIKKEKFINAFGLEKIKGIANK